MATLDDLPNELILDIIRYHVGDHKTLSNLTKVSRRLNVLATPTLYERVVDLSLNQRLALWRSFRNNDALRNHVKSCGTISVSERKLASNGACAELCDYPKLDEVRIEISPVTRRGRGAKKNMNLLSLPAMARASTVQCFLPYRDGYDPICSIEAIRALISLPSIRTLECPNYYLVGSKAPGGWPGSPLSASPLNTLRLCAPRGIPDSAFGSCLDWYCFSGSLYFEDLLRGLKKLETLSCRNMFVYDMNKTRKNWFIMDTGFVPTGLRHVKSTLRHLQLVIDRDVTNGDDEYRGFVGIGNYNFRELESLTSLHISSSYIFSHGGPHPDREELWNHLPPQLEKLQIRMHWLQNTPHDQASNSLPWPQINFGSHSSVFSACRLTRQIVPQSDRKGLNEFEPSDVKNISEEQTGWLRKCLWARTHEQLVETPYENAPRHGWQFPQS